MSDREIRAYGPNYDTEHLSVDLDKKVRALGAPRSSFSVTIPFCGQCRRGRLRTRGG